MVAEQMLDEYDPTHLIPFAQIKIENEDFIVSELIRIQSSFDIALPEEAYQHNCCKCFRTNNIWIKSTLR